MMDEVGAIFADHSLVGQVAMMNGQPHANDEDRKMARNQVITIHFILCTNEHHQAYLHELSNQFLSRQHIYDTT